MTADPTVVYGHIPAELANVPRGAVQCSPLMPGVSTGDLAEIAPEALGEAVILAPPGTLERRRVLALAIRGLRPGGRLTALAPNMKGGARLADELVAFGCAVDVQSKRHHRIVTATRPADEDALDIAAIDAAIEGGGPRFVEDLGLWSEPGVFSYDRLDPASAMLLEHVPVLAGRGADIGCGIGVLAWSVVARGQCRFIALIDSDRRAVVMAARNVPSRDGVEVRSLWRDVRSAKDMPTGLDFVVMNPPFHDGGAEDRSLGIQFVAKAAQLLRPGGMLWMVANRHLPYEAKLAEVFESFEQVATGNGYKVLSARKGLAKPRRAPRPERGAGRGEEPASSHPIPGYETVPSFKVSKGDDDGSRGARTGSGKRPRGGSERASGSSGRTRPRR